MIKLIVSDMDGTFLNNHQEITEFNRSAIDYAREKGVEFMIATGRNYTSVRPILEQYQITCSCMLMNGAEFRNPEGRIVKKLFIPYEKGQRLIQLLEQQGFYPEIMDSDSYYSIYSKEQARIGMIGRMRCLRPQATEEELVEMMEESIFYKHLKYADSLEELRQQGIEIAKIMLFHQDSALIERTREMIKQLGDFAVSSSYPTNIEINDILAQKGLALKEYIQDRGIQKEEVMVFGDGLNDYSLFTEFPNSFAPENAMEEIKELAGTIIESNEDNGVGKTIYQYI